MLLGTDIGYFEAKGVNPKEDDPKKRRVKTFSVWGEQQDFVQNSSVSSNGHQQQIKVGTATKFIGESAIEQSIFQTRRQDRNWIESSGYLALHLFLITEMTTSTNPQIELVTGLPVSYLADREKLSNLLSGSHQVSRPGRIAQRITINNILCLPQGSSAIFNKALSEAGRVLNNVYSMGNVGILDIGGHTVNIATFQKLRLITRQTETIKAGMWNVLKDVAKRINAAYPGQDLHGHEVFKVIERGWIKQRGRKQDVNGIIYDAISPFISQILGEASQVWGEAARMDAILLVGGGAHVAGKAIRDQYEHAEIDDDPQWSNVEGYVRYGKYALGV